MLCLSRSFRTGFIGSDDPGQSPGLEETARWAEDETPIEFGCTQRPPLPKFRPDCRQHPDSGTVF